MSVMTIQAPITCPRHGCLGSVYAHLTRRSVTVGTYYVLKVEDMCTGGLGAHGLTEKEWEQAADEAEEIARTWNDKRTRAVSL